MIVAWPQLNQEAQTIYYIGVGSILLGTTIRYIHSLVGSVLQDRKLARDMREFYLPNIYFALNMIAKKMDIELNIEPIPQPPGPNPSHEKTWIRSGLLRPTK